MTVNTFSKGGQVLLVAFLLLLGVFVTPALADAPSTAFTYTGTWADGANGEKATEELNATATLAFNVTGSDGRVGISGLKTPWSGKASVQIDSQTPVVKSLYLDTGPKTVEWYLSPLLATGPHTVKVTVLHQKASASQGFWVSIMSARLVRAELGSGPPPPVAACADGVDNDADGKVDLADPGCSSSTDNDETDVVTPPGSPFIPYGPTSLLQSRIPVDGPVSSDNAFFRTWEQANEPVDYWKLRVTSAGFAQNYDEGQCSDPVFTIVSTGSVPTGQGFLKTSGFHANEAVLAAMVQNSDSPIMVRDFCGTSDRPNGFSVWAANVLYDGTHVLKSGGDGVITAGSFDWRTNGLDSRAPSSNAAAGVNMVSRGRIPDSMVITDAELRAGMDGANNGTAGHSVEIFFVETNSSAGFQEPMVGAEGGNVGCGGSAHTGLCAEGQYVRIDPTLPVPAGCTGAAAVVFRTLQQYGGYIGDNSGSGSGIKMQAGTTLVGNNSLQPCMHLNQLQIMQKGFVPAHS